MRMTKEEFENLPVGETFVCGNKVLLVSKSNGTCEHCIFIGLDCFGLQCIGVIPRCTPFDRNDKIILYL